MYVSELSALLMWLACVRACVRACVCVRLIIFSVCEVRREGEDYFAFLLMFVSLHCLHVLLFVFLSSLPAVKPHQWRTYPCDWAPNTVASGYLQCSYFKVLVVPFWCVLFCCA